MDVRALDLLPARRTATMAGNLRREARRLGGESSYLMGICGPDDSEWLAIAERMAANASCLETEARRLERAAKGLNAWSALAFATAPRVTRNPLPPILPGVEAWRVIDGGKAYATNAAASPISAAPETGDAAQGLLDRRRNLSEPGGHTL